MKQNLKYWLALVLAKEVQNIEKKTNKSFMKYPDISVKQFCLLCPWSACCQLTGRRLLV